MLTITTSSSSRPLLGIGNNFTAGNQPFISTVEDVFAEGMSSVRALQMDGISVFIADVLFSRYTPVNIKVAGPVLMMNFTLSGEFKVKTDSENVIRLQQQQHYTGIPPETEEDLLVTGSARLLVVCIYGDVLQKLYAGNHTLIGKLTFSERLPGRPLTLPMTEVINAVLHCLDNHCLHQIFLAAKMLELLYISLNQLNAPQTAKPIQPVKSNDLEKLEMARQIIRDNLKEPYSLLGIAHKVGLNDFKLKKGFRDVFGTTVFGHLLDVRMEKARAMLATGDHKISEVAHEVGYKNPHHFSSAFKKKYGYLPSKLPAVN